MPVVRWIVCASLCGAVFLVGCRHSASLCAEATPLADPAEIPSGQSATTISVRVNNPDPDNGLEVVTKITAVNGMVADPSARETTYACAHDVSGPIEICVTSTFRDPGSNPDGNALYESMPEAGVPLPPQSEVPDVGGSHQFLRTPHVRIHDPIQCSETRCTTVTCPEDKKICPIVSSLTVEPMVVGEDETATIEVVAEDPDNGPQPLVTTLSGSYGTIPDVHANLTTYTCDPDVGGAIQICVVASDGDSSCDAERCTTVGCPGEPLENTCPVIADFTASPMSIPPGETDTLVVVDVFDPDGHPFFTRLSSETGMFEDHTASETIFRCGASGPVQLCVEATDGDPECEETRCITVQCPSTIPVNICPMLFVINAIPSAIPAGETTTRVQTRGQDTDGLPIPLVLTLDALWGSFEDTENIPEQNNVIAQNATYICDRPGPVEICVDATDGACTKTLCRDILCPDDVPTSP